MKKLFITTTILSTFIFTTSVFAEGREEVRFPNTPEISRVAHVEEGKEKFLEKNLSQLQKRGVKIIEERIHSLEDNKKAIENSKSLTAEQKNTLTAILSKNITGLTAMVPQMKATTDATTTKALIDSVYSQYRVYGIVIPQVRLEKRIFDLQNHVPKLSESFLKLEAKIVEWKTKGHDVTEWQKKLEDAKLLVATDVGLLTVLSNKVIALTPADYGTSSKTTINQVNTDLKKIQQDFRSINSKVYRPSVMGKMKYNKATSTLATSTATQ